MSLINDIIPTIALSYLFGLRHVPLLYRLAATNPFIPACDVFVVKMAPHEDRECAWASYADISYSYKSRGTTCNATTGAVQPLPNSEMAALK